MTQEAINIYNEGYYYYTGSNGYPLNYNKAIERFNTAAQMGVSDAMNYLGVIYLEGKIVNQNFPLAENWFRKAAQTEPVDMNAFFNLGRMYYNGWGVEANNATAKEFFERAIAGCKNTSSPYPQCCFLLGEMYCEIYKNYNLAFKHFNEAAHKGNIPAAWYYMGFLIENHVYPSKFDNLSREDKQIERDKMARDYYEKAANLGYPAGMDCLGRLYLKYNRKDIAMPWIEKAASLGDENAQKRLKLFKAADSGSILNMGSTLLDLFRK